MIEQLDAVRLFEALAHETRLAILRHLIPAGPRGRPAGEVGAALGIGPTRLSFHLGRLTAARLLKSRREGRRLYYAVNYPALAGLVRFLGEDCCAAAPEGCLPECPSLPTAQGGFRLPSTDRRDPTIEKEED